VTIIHRPVTEVFLGSRKYCGKAKTHRIADDIKVESSKSKGLLYIISVFILVFLQREIIFDVGFDYPDHRSVAPLMR
jgi:hypothetical protein